MFNDCTCYFLLPYDLEKLAHLLSQLFALSEVSSRFLPSCLASYLAFTELKMKVSVQDLQLFIIRLLEVSVPLVAPEWPRVWALGLLFNGLLKLFVRPFSYLVTYQEC